MADYDSLMERLAKMIDYIVKVDMPVMDEEDRAMLVGHLTGAVIVTVMDHDREAQGMSNG